LAQIYNFEESLRTDVGAGGIGSCAVNDAARFAYTQNPARVLRLLSANAIERVRTSAVHAFADAFVLRKQDRDRG
jgi:hypothetical protein